MFNPGDAPTLSDEINACKELDNFLDQFNEQMGSGVDKNQSFPVKNALELKRSLIRNFCREQLVSYDFFLIFLNDFSFILKFHVTYYYNSFVAFK